MDLETRSMADQLVTASIRVPAGIWARFALAAEADCSELDAYLTGVIAGHLERRSRTRSRRRAPTVDRS